MKITPEMKSLFDQMPGAWGCKDENSVFLYANEEYAKIIGENNKSDIIGKTDFDMPCDTINSASLFQKQDRKVIQHLKKIRALDIHPFSGGQWKAYIFTKTPLLDKSEKCIGTIFHGADVTDSNSLEIGSLLSRVKEEGVSNDLLGQNSYMVGGQFQKKQLTTRQSEVLFYSLRGKQVKQIAFFMSLPSNSR